MRLFHENPIFSNSEIESDNFTVWNSEIIIFNLPRNLYNSLKSIKEISLLPDRQNNGSRLVCTELTRSLIGLSEMCFSLAVYDGLGQWK